MLELLAGDSLRAHSVFQDDVRSRKKDPRTPMRRAVCLHLCENTALSDRDLWGLFCSTVAGMAFAVKRVRQLVDGSLDGRVVDGWETACQQAPSQVLASLLKQVATARDALTSRHSKVLALRFSLMGNHDLICQYLRDLPFPLFPYNKCVPLGVVLMEQVNPIDSEDVEGHTRAAVLKEQVALRLADGLQPSELLLAVRLFRMLSETAIVRWASLQLACSCTRRMAEAAPLQATHTAALQFCPSSSVNGMTTAKLAIAMETVVTWRDEQRSVAPHLSNFNDR